MRKGNVENCVLDLIISILLVGTILKGSLITFIQKILFNFARSPYKTPESTEMWYYFQCYYTILYYTYQEEKVHLPRQKERFWRMKLFVDLKKTMILQVVSSALQDTVAFHAISRGIWVYVILQLLMIISHSKIILWWLNNWSCFLNHNQPFGIFGYIINR